MSSGFAAPLATFSRAAWVASTSNSNTPTVATTTESASVPSIASSAAAANSSAGQLGGSTCGEPALSRPTASTACTSWAARVNELVMIFTRGPAGSGSRAQNLAMSNIAPRRCTTITPAWRNNASTALSGAWLRPPRTPRWAARSARPGAITTTGFRRVSRRVIRENFRGLPIESKESRQTRVASSSSQYCMTSLPVTSARVARADERGQPQVVA